MNDDWFVKRFYLSKRRNTEAAFITLVQSLKWRKQMRLSELQDNSFPIEFYQSGSLFPYLQDLKSNYMIYVRICFHKKLLEIEELRTKYICFVLNKLDLINNGNGVGLVLDLTNANYSNLDLDLLKVFIQKGAYYFPLIIRYVLVYNMPWYLNAVRKVVTSLLPEDALGIIKFGSGDDIYNYVGKQNLPDFLGGECMLSYKSVPKGARPLKEILKEHSHFKNSDQVFKYFEEICSATDTQAEYTENNQVFDYQLTNKINTDKIVAPSNVHETIELEPKDKLRFRFDSKNLQFISQLLIKNILTKSVAFKVQSNLSSKFSVQPSFGIISPKSFFKITLKTKLSEEAQAKFLIQTLELDEDNMREDSFYDIWLKRKAETVLYKLSTSFDQQATRNGFKTDISQVKESQLKPVNSRQAAHEHLKQDNLDKKLQYYHEKLKKISKRQKQTWLILNVALFLIFIMTAYLVNDYFQLKSQAGIKQMLKSNLP